MKIWKLLFSWENGEQDEHTYFESSPEDLEQFITVMEKRGAKLMKKCKEA